MRISDWSSDVCSSDLSLVRYEAAWERRIGDGSLVVAARHESISNLVDRVVVVSDDGTFDSAGNIGHATRDEVEANLNLPHDPLGLRGLTVKGNALFRRSRVRAPLNGARSEESRVGKGCVSTGRSGWAPDHS